MRSIHIISKLILSNDSLQAKDSNGIFDKISLQQGSIDGACSVYSLMMNLLILEQISFNDIQVYQKPDDKETRQLCKRLFEENGMHHDGQSFYRIQRILNESFSNRATCYHPKATHKQAIPLIVNHLKSDLPVIISIEYDKGGAHALLCVGYEGTEKKVSKLFCLDPSSQKINNCYWNTIIDLQPDTNRRKYPYHYITTDFNIKEDVRLDDILILTPIESH